jgi:hypothetical protein
VVVIGADLRRRHPCAGAGTRGSGGASEPEPEPADDPAAAEAAEAASTAAAEAAAARPLRRRRWSIQHDCGDHFVRRVATMFCLTCSRAKVCQSCLIRGLGKIV